MIPMIMNREAFYLASVVVSFVLGALFTYVRFVRTVRKGTRR